MKKKSSLFPSIFNLLQLYCLNSILTMVCNDSISPSFSSQITPPDSQPTAVVISPCAACKILRRRCADKCVLAPYFPPTEPLKFTIAHRVFGASNIIKFLQVLLFYKLLLVQFCLIEYFLWSDTNKTYELKYWKIQNLVS